MIELLIGFVVMGFVATLAVIIVVDFYRWCHMSEKERFYNKESKRYKDFDLKVGITEYKK